MWVWAKAHQGQKCSATPPGLCKPQEHREFAVPRQLTTTSHPWLQAIAHSHSVHLHSLSSLPILYLITWCSGQEDFRGFLPQQKTEVLSTDLWKCESSFSGISLLFLTCLCFTESLQKAQREATSRKGLCDFLILSPPIRHLQAVLCGAQHPMSACFVSLLDPHLKKDAKSCPGPTHPNSSC